MSTLTAAHLNLHLPTAAKNLYRAISNYERTGYDSDYQSVTSYLETFQRCWNQNHQSNPLLDKELRHFIPSTNESLLTGISLRIIQAVKKSF